jgi:hypothetical protein
MNRMKWQRCGSNFQTTDGRFVIHPACNSPHLVGYLGLTDTLTGREFPCRTEASAKAAARNILRGEEQLPLRKAELQRSIANAVRLADYGLLKHLHRLYEEVSERLQRRARRVL